jgi:hypothetical protein
MGGLIRDVRGAFRLIARNPEFSCLVLPCLALGIGLNTAIFSVVDTLLLRPLPYPDPDRIVLLFDVARGAKGKPEQYNASSQNFLTWKAQSTVFEGVAAMDDWPRRIAGRDPAVQQRPLSDRTDRSRHLRAGRGGPRSRRLPGVLAAGEASLTPRSGEIAQAELIRRGRNAERTVGRRLGPSLSA